MPSKILLPDNYHLAIHTSDFTSKNPHSIISTLQWGVSADWIHSIPERQARFVHQKVSWVLDSKSLVLELGIASDHAREIMENTLDIDATFGEFCRKEWTHVYSLFPIDWLKNTDLYRSDEEFIEYAWKKWKVKFWFCGSRVDCGVHNEHDFLEWHIGVAGDGRMEKFTDFDEKTLIESYRMSPGQTHPIFAYAYKKDPNGNPLYPPHRWFGGNTGDVWLVVEEYF